jgi:hypothetical protein
MSIVPAPLELPVAGLDETTGTGARLGLLVEVAGVTAAGVADVADGCAQAASKPTIAAPPAIPTSRGTIRPGR